MKSAVIVLSDPRGGDEALGRFLNALSVAYDYKQQGDEVSILFLGAGTRWIAELNNTNHPAYTLFDSLKDTVAGISSGCADVFGATEDVEKSAFNFIKDLPLPGTSGVPSLHAMASQGYTIMTF